METLPVSPYQKYQETHTEHCYSTIVINHQHLSMGRTVVVEVQPKQTFFSLSVAGENM